MDNLVESYNFTKEYVQIQKEPVLTKVLKERLDALTEESIIFAIEEYRDQLKKQIIKTPRPYLRSILFNAASDYDERTRNQLMNDAPDWFN